jgi:hypothetical protein
MQAFLLLATLVAVLACAEDDTRLERRGPSDTVEPRTDPDQGGAAAAAGANGVGGSGASGNAEGGAGGAQPIAVPFCEALSVLAAKCQRCHQDPPQNGAPAPFLTYEDTQAEYADSGRPFFELMLFDVEQGFMPLVALNEPPTSLMPPVQPLTVDEKRTLLTWLEQGAKPVGGTDCP